jgi:hypothetical protein
MRKSWICALTAIILSSALSGCSQGKRPFLIAQLCLRDAQDRAAFVRELESIARSEGMTVIDNSENTQKELRAIGSSAERSMSRPVINMGVEHGQGVGLTANNVGTPGGEVAIGFSEGSNPPEAHRFAELVVGKLKEHWQVETVPDPAKSGALPMADCH